MTDRIRELLKNQGVRFTRETAEVQLKRAGVTLSPDWTRQRGVKSSTDETTAAEPTARRVMGG